MYSDLSKRRSRNQAGLSLVEIMVGVLIGMIGIIVIFQMLATSESRKRTVSAGSDVQVTGIIGLTSIERDVREAGYGFSSAGYDTGITPVMGCMVNAYDTARPTPAFTYRLTPIQIIQGAGTASDTVIVLRGNGNTFPAAHVFTESTDTSKKTRGRAGISPRDYVLIGRVTPTLDCMTAEITDVTDVDALTIRHNQGSYSYTLYLPDGSTSVGTRIARHNNAAPPTSFTAGYIFNLGNGPRRNIWTVNQVNQKLQVTNDLLHSDVTASITDPPTPAGPDGVNDPVEVADNVITLQAEYGIDANNNGRIESSEWTTTDPAAVVQWANVLAVRLALLVRSGQFERTTVTTTVPSWAGGQFTITNLDGSASSSTPADPANNWRNYRYRVYETVIPLRNMLWGSNIRP
ncbi:MAG: PilW family protein [Burkholderiales bacterium]|jgi:type IV pilus assembly protein PilW|nr:PilW family protein [Burkholderiales bacterium]